MHLVTGGTGIVGARILFELVKAGESVRVLVRPGSDKSWVERIFRFLDENGQSLFEKIEWVEGDVLDIVSLEKAMDGVEYVYHTVAVVSFN